MAKRISAIILLAAVLCGCGMQMSIDDMLEPPRMTEEQSAIYDALETAIGTDSFKLKYPRTGENRSACTLSDLDGDGREEAVVFYELTSGGTTATWISILAEQNGRWKSVKQISGEAGEVDRLEFASILGEHKSVLVGWSSAGEDNGTCIFYTYGDGRMDKYETDYTYHDMLIADLNTDGRDEIVLCTVGSSRSGEMQLLQEVDGEIMRTSVLDMPSRLSGYRQVAFGELARGLPAIFADITLSNGETHTILAAVDNTAARTVLTRINSDELGLYGDLDRLQSQTVCADVNGDGLIDIPVATALPGYEDAEDPLWLTTYMSVISGTLTPVQRTVYNEAAGYAFSFPDNWANAVSVRKFADNGEWRFVLYNGDLTDDAAAELLRIRVLSPSYYQDKFETAVYTTIAAKGIYEYQISVPKEQAAGYNVTTEEAQNLFSLLT